MLAVNYKLTDQLDFATPVMQYISENFSPQQAGSVKQAVDEVDVMRKKVMMALVKNDTDYAGSIKLMSDYYSHITRLNTRFPFGKPVKSGWGKKKIECVSVPFGWADSFKKGKKDIDYSVQYEQNAIVFNIGE